MIHLIRLLCILSFCNFFKNLGIESFELDLKREVSINNAVKLIKEKTKSHLDALYNNGAYAIPGAIQDMPRDALREIFEVNVFGQIDLINKCIPLMMSSKSPKIINCSSVLGFISLPYRGVYSATKFSIEALTDAMRRENYYDKLNEFMNGIDALREKASWSKDDILKLFFGLIPEFAHKETGKYLDQRM